MRIELPIVTPQQQQKPLSASEPAKRQLTKQMQEDVIEEEDYSDINDEESIVDEEVMIEDFYGDWLQIFIIKK